MTEKRMTDCEMVHAEAERLRGDERPAIRESGRAESRGARIDELFREIYPELRSVASAWFRNESPGHTLQPTALVHEAFLRLSVGSVAENDDPCYFFAAAANAMRRILVEHARRKAGPTRKPPGHRLAIEEVNAGTMATQIDLLALDEAMAKLAEKYERASRIVEFRFFGGLTIDQTAEVMDLSPRSVDLDWRFARAWLLRKLTMETVS